MRQKKPALRQAGFIVFSIAITLGVLIILVRAVPDMESTMYGFIKYGYPRLTSLSCPMMMTLLDRQPVTIHLQNPLDRSLSWYVSAQISAVPLMVDTSETVELQPGETRVLSWEVSRDNIDLFSFIFARVYTSAAYSAGMRESTCGTFVLKLPIKGGLQIFYASIALAALGIIVGSLLWFRHAELSDPWIISQSWWMRFMTIVVIVGVVLGILNLWFFATVTILLCVLSVAVFLVPRKI